MGLTAEQIMRKMGYPDDEQGHYVTLLREEIALQVANGLANRSAGTWSSDADKLSFEQRAKAQLAFDWAANNGYSYRVECLDPIIIRQIDLRTKKRTIRIDWPRIPAATRDFYRRVKYIIRKPFLPRNPYL